MLIADDDRDQRDMYARYLTTKGFPVMVATNGAEAVIVARQAHPDMIVMDLSMPHLDGWEATRRLKQDPSTQDIPVVICTGHVADRAAEFALEAGCDAYLVKPCLPRDLLAEIQRVRKRRKRLR